MGGGEKGSVGEGERVCVGTNPAESKSERVSLGEVGLEAELSRRFRCQQPAHLEHRPLSGFCSSPGGSWREHVQRRFFAGLPIMLAGFLPTVRYLPAVAFASY